MCVLHLSMLAASIANLPETFEEHVDKPVIVVVEIHNLLSN